MEVPKFIKGVAKYFTYASGSGETTPTTQADLQELMKNNNTILECLVDGLWQPEKEMKLNQIVRSPNMPANTIAKVTATGTTGTTEPEWPETVDTTVSDGNVSYIMKSQVTDIAAKAIIDLTYKVSQIVEYASNVNPNDLYPWQTWEQIKDVFTLASGDKYSIGQTGGVSTVTLTVAQIPEHIHIASVQNASLTGRINGSANSSNGYNNNPLSGSGVFSGSGAINGYGEGGEWNNGTATWAGLNFGGTHNHDISIETTGGGEAHNNMPPYLVTIKWKRTA
ncbi:phage baseplate protein [Phascolarctobacterium faecium]|uniref:phage baseplate protein n=1 Tax=Phascolarctobacterium faecium TaxID=33025 RepID=UPI00307959ED